MNPLPPSEVVCFCDNRTANLILSYVDNKLTSKQTAKLKATLIEYLEWPVSDRGFDEGFVLGFIESLFTDNPKDSFKKFFSECCYDGFALLNKKLNVLICGKIESFKYYCTNLHLPFLKTFTEAVNSYGGPIKFIKDNKYTFKRISEFYSNLYFQDRIDEWVPGASELVQLCDFLGISVSPIGTSPEKWGVHESEMRRIAGENSKKDCLNFAKLFSKKPEFWFDNDWLWNFKDS